MTLEQEIKEYLISHPAAREQKYINQATWGFLSKKYNFDVLERDLFYKIGTKFDSVRRLIAKIQYECPELRGNDFSDRRVREQEKIMDLGYEVGFRRDIKLASRV